jgi:hypothetical protein
MRAVARTSALLVLLVSGFASPARAQGSGSFADVWFAYMMEHLDDLSLHTGFEAGASIPLGGGSAPPPFDLVLVFSLSHRGTGYDPGDFARGPVPVANAIGGPAFGAFTLVSFGGGLQRTFMPRGRLTPFVRVTAGIQTCCETTAFYVQPSIGGTVPLSAILDFYADLGLRFLRGDGEGAQSFRGAFGVALPIRRR